MTNYSEDWLMFHTSPDSKKKTLPLAKCCRCGKVVRRSWGMWNTGSIMVKEGKEYVCGACHRKEERDDAARMDNSDNSVV